MSGKKEFGSDAISNTKPETADETTIILVKVAISLFCLSFEKGEPLFCSEVTPPSITRTPSSLSIFGRHKIQSSIT
jgi:hypothetical protein